MAKAYNPRRLTMTFTSPTAEARARASLLTPEEGRAPTMAGDLVELREYCRYLTNRDTPLYHWPSAIQWHVTGFINRNTDVADA